jgi:hypothetical protein
MPPEIDTFLHTMALHSRRHVFPLSFPVSRFPLVEFIGVGVAIAVGVRKADCDYSHDGMPRLPIFMRHRVRPGA